MTAEKSWEREEGVVDSEYLLVARQVIRRRNEQNERKSRKKTKKKNMTMKNT